MTYQRRIEKGYEEMTVKSEFNEKLTIRQANENIYDRAERIRKKPTIYFAHPFDKWKTPQEEWIMKRLEEMGYIPYNPFDEEDDLNKKYGVENYYDNPCIEFADEIVERDFAAVDRCDAIFAWIPKGITTIGTIREIDRAHRSGKEVIVMCYKPNPFLRMADKLYISYRDFLDGVEYIWKSCKDLKKHSESQ